MIEPLLLACHWAGPTPVLDEDDERESLTVPEGDSASESDAGCALHQPVDLPVKSASMGFSFGCAVTATGALVCWDPYGSDNPPSPTEEVGWALVETSVQAVCALDTEGSPSCWGGSLEEAQYPLGPFVGLAVADTFACGLRPEGTVACWGPGAPSSEFVSSLAGVTDITADASTKLLMARYSDGTMSSFRMRETEWSVVDARGERGDAFDGLANRDPQRGAWRRSGAVQPGEGSSEFDFGFPVKKVAATNAGYCALGEDEHVECRFVAGWTGELPSPHPDCRFSEITLGVTERSTPESCGVQTDGRLGCWVHH